MRKKYGNEKMGIRYEIERECKAERNGGIGAAAKNET